MADPETDVKRLVLVGDFIEMWLYPFKETPKTAKSILNSKKLFKTNVLSFMKQFKKIVENDVILDIVVGNHDLELKFAIKDLKKVISDKINVHDEEFIYNGVVRFEHGHRYDLFNAPDPRGIRPVGYYVSRAVATVNYGDGQGEQAKSIQICRDLDPKYFADLSVLALRSSFVFGFALELMFDQVLGDYDDYKDRSVKGGNPKYTSTKTLKLKDIKEQYDDLVSLWRDVYEQSHPDEDPDEFVFGMIKGGCGDNSWWVKYLADPIIIFGHTHEPIPPTFYDNRLDKQTLYVNSGAWIDGGSMTYVDLVENSEDSFTVNLMKYSSSTKRSFYGPRNDTVTYVHSVTASNDVVIEH
jgi:UDP-2,3-diacylglucosamine pyrophosphatase LpxH